MCEPADDECSQVLRDVWLFLDNEMDPENRAKVQHHLDDCSPCLVEAGVDRQLKALLRAKCGGDTAPAALRSRLVESIERRTTVADATGSVTLTERRITITETPDR